MTAKLNT